MATKKGRPEFAWDEHAQKYRKRLLDPATGKYSINIYASTIAEMRQLVAERRQELAAEADDLARLRSPSVPVYQYAALWHQLNTRKLKKGARDNHASNINNHICPVIGQMAVRDVRPDDIRRVMAGVEHLSKATQTKVLRTVRAIFRSAVENDLIAKSPCVESIKAAGAPTEEKLPLTQAQQRQLIDAVDGCPIRTFVLLGLCCGLRREESLALMWDAVHLDADTPWLEVKRAMRWEPNRPIIDTELKSRSAARRIPIPEPLLTHLRDLPHECELVCHNRGAAYSQTAFRQAWSRIESMTVRDYTYTSNVTHKPVTLHLGIGDSVPYKPGVTVRLDFSVTPHQLRHTYITELFLAGADLKTVQYLAGHSDIRTTLNIYTHLMQNRPEDLSPAVTSAMQHLASSGES